MSHSEKRDEAIREAMKIIANPPKQAPFPPETLENARHECFFLLKRCRDLLDVIDGKTPNFTGDAVEYARKAVEARERMHPKHPDYVKD